MHWTSMHVTHFTMWNGLNMVCVQKVWYMAQTKMFITRMILRTKFSNVMSLCQFRDITCKAKIWTCCLVRCKTMMVWQNPWMNNELTLDRMKEEYLAVMEMLSSKFQPTLRMPTSSLFSPVARGCHSCFSTCVSIWLASKARQTGHKYILQVLLVHDNPLATWALVQNSSQWLPPRRKTLEGACLRCQAAGSRHQTSCLF